MTNHPHMIEDLWESYRKSVIPEGAPPVQLEETRLAFWAGCISTFGLLAELGEERYSEDDGAAVLEGLHREIQAYIMGMKT